VALTGSWLFPHSCVKQNHHTLQLQAKCRRMKKMSEDRTLEPVSCVDLNAAICVLVVLSLSGDYSKKTSPSHVTMTFTFLYFEIKVFLLHNNGGRLIYLKTNLENNMLKLYLPHNYDF
jgi:hypothetical protein